MTKIHTCRFVVRSELFAGLESLDDLVFMDCPITFGDANRTMVDLSYLLGWVFDKVSDEDGPDITELKARLSAAKAENVDYVDLEN